MDTNFHLKILAFVTVGVVSGMITSLTVLAVLLCRFKIRKAKEHQNLMDWKKRVKREWVKEGLPPFFPHHSFLEHSSTKRSHDSSSGYCSRKPSGLFHSDKPCQSISRIKKDFPFTPAFSLPLPSDSLPNLFHLPQHLAFSNDTDKRSKFSEAIASTISSTHDQSQHNSCHKTKSFQNALKSSLSHLPVKKTNMTSVDNLTLYSADDSGYSPTGDSKTPSSFLLNFPRLTTPYPQN